MPRTFAVAALAAALVAPASARGHEVLHEVVRGRAVAVKAYHADGEVLADTRFEIYSPADPRDPHQEGRTDRSGWLAFVPDVPGKWRVKVIDDTGHGLDVEVDAAAAASAAAPPGTASPRSALAFILRPVVGLAVVAAVFGVLLAVYRRKGAQP